MSDLVPVYWETQPAGFGMGGMTHVTKAHWRERGADRTLCGRKVPEAKVANTHYSYDGKCGLCEKKGGALRNLPAPPKPSSLSYGRREGVQTVEVFSELLEAQT